MWQGQPCANRTNHQVILGTTLCIEFARESVSLACRDASRGLFPRLSDRYFACSMTIRRWSDRSTFRQPTRVPSSRAIGFDLNSIGFQARHLISAFLSLRRYPLLRAPSIFPPRKSGFRSRQVLLLSRFKNHPSSPCRRLLSVSTLHSP